MKSKLRCFDVHVYDGDINRTAVDGKRWQMMSGYDFYALDSDGYRRLFWWSPRFGGHLKICVHRKWSDGPKNIIPVWQIAKLEAAFAKQWGREKVKAAR